MTRGSGTSLTAGAIALSWYPNDWLRFMLQLQYVNVNKLNSAGTVQIGQRFETLAAQGPGGLVRRASATGLVGALA